METSEKEWAKWNNMESVQHLKWKQCDKQQWTTVKSETCEKQKCEKVKSVIKKDMLLSRRWSERLTKLCCYQTWKCRWRTGPINLENP